ncbi:MAG: NADH-quinone oxidoreductase subunit NuoE [Firmicutes bacterium]|nr:NADH-quinone oxidoreductase subunit NuoE [Bacillota bacterium]
MKLKETPQNIEEILGNYPQKLRSDLIPILQDVQELQGYISQDAIKQISGYLDLPTSKIFGVATFYNQFRLNPPGRHLVQVCRGTACHVKGSAKLLESLERELGIKAAQTTKDRRYTIEVVACMGACSIAPVICVDGNYHGRLDVKDLPAILEQYE